MSTISAISTAFGKGGIAVIRMSGEDSLNILNKVFVPFGKKNIEDYPPNTLIYGDIYKDGRIIDRGMAVYFKGPKSYTGEDSAELHCHGGILLSQMVLEATFTAGAVPAGAGEFTQRAFLSGKMGLSQAEAVIDLIDAQSESKAVLAASQADGRLSKKIDSIYSSLMAIVSSIYAYIDYPDEDLTDVSVEDMKSGLYDIKNELLKLKKTYRTGRAVCEGINTVIAGKPNTGKSSLLNMLLGEERAIVTSIAGTTRDTVEETLSAGRVLLRLCDTAGIRDADDEVEEIGVRKAIKKLEEAELVLAVFDGSRALDSEDGEVIRQLEELKDNKTVIVVLNKSDVANELKAEDFKNITNHVISISAKEEKGKDELIELIEKIYIDGEIEYSTACVVTNARQYASVDSALTHIESAIESLEKGFTQDIAGMELEIAMSHLGNLDGRKITEDVVSNIFGRFCIGK
ncbi:MAG: tRNA uridine-5-carboxymethylaminomethyl(34) synthesis GTPase MnmE [Ruminococcaceae bacterium]|nr:tRNA uridine-5-carboxymethylaminomethyl(34) synthesis GTPase MnmE [Oscillospiraceae bacterium]